MVDGKFERVSLHRFLLDEPEGLQVDHINCDTLNNTRKNLRAVTVSENQLNRKQANKNNHSSNMLGVTWHKGAGKWDARITLNGKRVNLGRFKNLEDAKRAVEEATALRGIG